MELTIYNPVEVQSLPEIKWNYEEIKTYAMQKAEEYKSIAYTDADVSAMKKDRADINRFITALENERKEKKKEYMAPYTAFELQIKDVLQPLREAAAGITSNLDEVEQQYREGRRAKMEGFYEKYSGDLRGLIPFQKTVKEEFFRRAFTDKKLEQAYADLFSHIEDELSALEELPERFRDKAALKYAETFNLSEALREGRRLEELEKLLEERRAKERERKEQERKAAEEALAQKPAPIVPVQNEEQEVEPCKEAADAPQIMQLDFRVRGTREQLMALRNYMIENKIQFGKVE